MVRIAPFASLSLCLAATFCMPDAIDIQVSCPPVRAWSTAEQAKLADAMAPIPESSPVWTAVLDWQRMRDALRACQNSAPKPS